MRLAHKILGKLRRKYLAITYLFKKRFGRPIHVLVDGSPGFRVYPEGQIALPLHLGIFETLERQLTARLLKPGMNVVDIGANVGLYSLTAEQLVGPGGKIWAVEPSTESYDRLLKNLKLNGAGLVTPVKVAFSSRDDQTAVLSMEGGRQDGERYLLPDGGKMEKLAETEIVQTLSLDTFCRRRSISKIDFIKMDIEGGEYQVLMGARDVLSKNPGLVMLFEHTPEGCARAGVTPEAIVQLLAEHGFHLYAWDETAKIWNSNHDYILSRGSAWATTGSERLPSL